MFIRNLHPPKMAQMVVVHSISHKDDDDILSISGHEDGSPVLRIAHQACKQLQALLSEDLYLCWGLQKVKLSRLIAGSISCLLELFSERTERKQVHAASIPKIGSDETSSKKNDLLLLFPREIGSITSQKHKNCGCMGWVQHKLSSFPSFSFSLLFYF